MRIAAFGGWGQLGSDLAAAAADMNHELIRPTHAEVDVTDAESVRRFLVGSSPDVAIDAAAFHKTEDCELEAGRALVVNAVGALNVARAAREVGARSVYVSTDYVFDGEKASGYVEDDSPAPLNVYGVSKLAGERLVRNADPAALVVRGSGMFGHAGASGKGGNFVETMLAKAAASEALSVVDDLVFAPTATRDMAERILMLVARAAPAGVYHLANAGACSWYGFAVKVFELGGIATRVSPRGSASEGVRRPRSSVLLDTKTEALALPPARPWEDALAWYLGSRQPKEEVVTGPAPAS
jgi:dTDP-4-dehydrorhamnose reductase